MKPKHVEISPQVYNDATISPLAFLAFAVILDCVEKGTNLGRISLPTLAKRLRCCRKTAWTAVQELERAGHIRNTAQRGACGAYQILTRVTDDTSGGVEAYTGGGVTNGANQCKNGPATSVAGYTQPIRSPNLPKDDDLEKTTAEGLNTGDLDHLASIVSIVSGDGNEGAKAHLEAEARVLLRRCLPFQRPLFFAHLKSALSKPDVLSNVDAEMEKVCRQVDRGEPVVTA